jgi:asparagine synthase (glutamine-hydrolysing)
MCGIAGIVNAQSLGAEAQGVLDAMLGELSRRGPERTRSLRSAGSLLGHALLSFGLMHQEQPARSSCGAVTLVYNGEIYNHRELAERFGLDARSEANVVIELYLRFGSDFVRQLNGMFALVILDERYGKLLLARDPLGKKPLYYFKAGREIAFASELKALWKHPSCPAQVDPEALARFCFFQAIPAPRTLVSGVYKLRAGHFVEFDQAGEREVAYFQLKSAASPSSTGRPPDLELEDHLTRAVRRRIQSTNQKLGLALSGGIDSSLVAAITVRELGTNVPSWTVGFSDASFDESAAAASVARHLGIRHHVIQANGQRLADAATELFANLDEPLADPSLIPTSLLCREAKTEVKALLSGDGADEFFLGYLSFQADAALRLVQGAVPAPLLKGAHWLAQHLPPADRNLSARRVLGMLGAALDVPPALGFYAARAPIGLELLDVLTAAEFRGTLSAENALEEVRRFVGAEMLSERDELQRSIICHFLRDVILTKVDRASMLHSLEVRCPFLDVELVNWSMSLPEPAKFRLGSGKLTLRQLARRLLPAGVAQRRKRGFRAPIGKLLRTDLRELLLDALSARNVTKAGFFDARWTVRLIDAHLRGERDHALALWALLGFHLWYEKFSNERAKPNIGRRRALNVLSGSNATSPQIAPGSV